MRADPQSGSYRLTRVAFDTTRPNGVLVSQNQKIRSVAETNDERGESR